MSTVDLVVLSLPFRGTWLARNSPAQPSHGTDLFATTYAIDFIAVRGRRTATKCDWRTRRRSGPPVVEMEHGIPHESEVVEPLYDTMQS
jgi:hypothetical protein